MKKLNFRVYGDNIIECTRIINMIKTNSQMEFSEHLFPINQMSSSIKLTNNEFELTFELIPGFEKSNKKRWANNILTEFKKLGSVLDETADALITQIIDNTEKIMVVIEFCSALQAGNQAWQRSGRAYSCAKTKIPYFYIIDLPKYELNPQTRVRKALRFPNAIVPYSYVACSSINNIDVYEIITKSEEYDDNDPNFSNINMNLIFNDHELGDYLLNILINKDTTSIIKSVKQKNINFVNFLSSSKSSTSLSSKEIENLYPHDLAASILNLQKKFKFEKKIAKKSISGNLELLHSLITQNSIGIFSSDLPFGIIPKENIQKFIESLSNIYTMSNEIKNYLISKDHIIITMIKGFKPGGDDNRPDRGILPLLRMLFGENETIITVLYGPLIKSNYSMLMSDKERLSKNNGLWQTIINLSDYLIYDCPIIGENINKSGIEKMNHKAYYSCKNNSFEKLDLSPINYREDDVDSLFYLLFSYESNAFYGMCNPPGGDWSGLSLKINEIEYRWLSLPRVSDDKRPDHIVEFLCDSAKPFILTMESKEKAEDLEENIGCRLSQYIKWLLNSIPNVERKNDKWNHSNAKIQFSWFEIITSASFISKVRKDYSYLLKKSDCNIIFSLIPFNKKWHVDIFYDSQNATIQFIENTKAIFKNSNLIESIKYIEINNSNKVTL